jgi:hypothetical protein
MKTGEINLSMVANQFQMLEQILYLSFILEKAANYAASGDSQWKPRRATQKGGAN